MVFIEFLINWREGEADVLRLRLDIGTVILSDEFNGMGVFILAPLLALI